MPYAREADQFGSTSATASSPARKMAAISPAAADLALYPKALRIYVPASVSEASVVVVPAEAADDTGVTLKYPPGVWIEPGQMRRVVSATAGVEVHGYY